MSSFFDDPRVIGSLTEGWVHTATEKIDTLLSLWLVSDYSQSEVFHGTIMSLPYQIVKYGHEPDRFTQEISDTLTTYIGRYFDNVEVNVKYKYLEDNAIGGPYGITIEVKGNSNGVSVNLAKGLEIRDSKLSNIISISNGV